jgi:molybdenum cofactor guanylyltransferase
MSIEEIGSDKPINQVRGVTGVILAGGRSMRFGSNKAFAELGGVPLIERVVAVLGSVFEKQILITNNPNDYAFLGLPMYEDIIKGIGPLGGIYTGLERMSDDMGFFVACDMPFLNESLIRHITGMRDGVDAVIPRIDLKMEPLHSIYSKACIPAIRELIESGECMINRFYQRIKIRFMDEWEIKRFDPLARTFININRTDELAEAENLKWKKGS